MCIDAELRIASPEVARSWNVASTRSRSVWILANSRLNVAAVFIDILHPTSLMEDKGDHSGNCSGGYICQILTLSLDMVCNLSSLQIIPCLVHKNPFWGLISK